MAKVILEFVKFDQWTIWGVRGTIQYEIPEAFTEPLREKDGDCAISLATVRLAERMARFEPIAYSTFQSERDIELNIPDKTPTGLARIFYDSYITTPRTREQEIARVKTLS